jgi:hypothetical protein
LPDFTRSIRSGAGVMEEPLGVAVARPAWGLRVGVGYRLF